MTTFFETEIPKNKKAFFQAKQSSLFREQALENNTQRIFGTSFLPRSLSMWPMVLLLASICAVVLTIAIFGTFSTSANLEGKIVPSEGLIEVNAPVSGYIDEILIAVGAPVSEKTKIVTLFPNSSLRDLGREGDRYLSNLKEQIQGLAQERTALMEKTKLALELENNKIVEIKKQINTIEKESEELSKQLDIVLKLNSAFERLAAGDAASGLELSSSRLQVSQLKQQKVILDGAILRKKLELDQAVGQTQLLPVDLSLTVSNLDEKVASLSQGQIKYERDNYVDLFSPVKGEVSSVTAISRSRVEVGEKIASVISSGSSPEAHLYVSSRNFTSVAVGNVLKLEIDAYPREIFGTFLATVTEVSKSSLEGESTQQSEDNTDYFLVKCQFNDISDNDEISFKPGMVVTATVVRKKAKIWKLVLGVE